MESDSWLLLISIALLIGCAAFFSACETAISTFNKIRMKKKADDGDKKALSVMNIWDNYDKSLSSILVGSNIVNITASTLAALLATTLLGPARGTVVATVMMTALMLVFGEVLPKVLAKERADSFATTFSLPFRFAVRLFSPVSFLLALLTKAVKGPASEDQPPSITEEELIYMMGAIEEEGVLEEQERDLVRSALEFDEISLKEILTPRVNIVAVDVEAGIDELRKIIFDDGYSRVPVYEKSIDKIIGVLYSRDVMLRMISGEQMDIRGMLGKALYVHKGMKLSHLLASFKTHKLNLAVVVDEYGGTLGIVTMEDVLEELVGDIWDEDDEIPSSFTTLDDGSFEALGNYELSDLFEQLGIDGDKTETDYATVGGWALDTFAHIPKIGEEFEALGYRFTVLEMDGHRLKRLGIERIPEETADTDNGEPPQAE